MGASTGRDGIGGASVLASAELGDGDEAKRPTVQIGDPFEESKVLECCLELLEKGLLVSLQDLGAAGLTSSAGEMASAGGVGIDIDVARVPLREADMEPFEIMVSESQERMLAVVEPAKVAEVLAVCEKWQTGVGGDRRGHRQRPGADPARRRGRRRDAGRGAGRRLPALRPRARPSRRAGSTATGRRSSRAPRPRRRCSRCSPRPASPPSAGPSSSTTRSSARARCGGRSRADAAVLQIPEAGNAIAVSIDGNGRRVACDPYAGTIEAVLECAQNLACVGAEPLGLTNCLNFGNPEKPVPAWQLDRAVSGLADACKALGVPVVGGNVSLYNEGPEGPIYPTPVVGMVGELPDPAMACASAFAREGDAIALRRPLRTLARRLGAGQAARRARGGPPPARHRRRRRRLRRGARGGPRRQALLRPRRQRRRPRLRPGRVRDRRPASAAGSTSSPCASAAARRRRRSSARARRLPAQRRARGAGSARRDRARQGRRHDDRDRRRRSQLHRRARRRRERLALARRVARQRRRALPRSRACRTART